MKPVWLLIAFWMVTIRPVIAQDTTAGPWKYGGTVGINFSQVGLKNWSAGGENSLALNGLVTLFANYKSGKNAWDNTLELGYGVVKQGDIGTRKSDDKMALTSKYGRQANAHWSYSGLVDFRTQFAKGYNYGPPKVKISQFMAPAYVTLAAGAEWKPNDHTFALISPVTGKMTIVTDKGFSKARAFGVDSGKTVRAELGWLINASHKRTLMQGIDFQSKLNLFASYEDLKHIDVIWDNNLIMKVNKFVSSSVTTQLLYDNDIKDAKSGKAKWQFKEVLAVGLLYTF